MHTAENPTPKHITDNNTAVTTAEPKQDEKKDADTTTNTTQETKKEYTQNTPAPAH